MYTPGPWMIASPLIKGSPYRIHSDTHRDLASIPWSGNNTATANAHLIASAPALLEALEKMRAYNLAEYRLHQAGCPTHSQDVGCTCGSAEARAAIAEAKLVPAQKGE